MSIAAIAYITELATELFKFQRPELAFAMVVDPTVEIADSFQLVGITPFAILVDPVGVI
ncbi:MAG: hypothetical protein MK161_04450 [Pirellulales bacterium]|nr:hypothetical protein [Pirellulales bacterium]